MYAFELIQDGHWCQGALARDKHGISSEFYEPRAVKFCAAGAIGRVYTNVRERNEVGDRLSLLLDARRAGSTPGWNDAQERDVQEVISLLMDAELGMAPEYATEEIPLEVEECELVLL